MRATELKDHKEVYVAQRRLAIHAEAEGDHRRAWEHWTSAADATGASASKAARRAIGAARRDNDYRTAKRNSDAAQSKNASGPDAVASHTTLYSLAASFADLRWQADAADRLADTHEARGEFADAAAWSQTAARCAPTLQRQARQERSERVVELEAEVLPALAVLGDLDVYVQIGRDHRRGGRNDHAIVIYLCGRKAFATAPVLLNSLAGALREADQPKLAAAQVARSLELDPSQSTNPAAHTIRCWLMCDDGRSSQAHKLALQLIALHPRDTHILRVLVHAAVRCHEFHDADRYHAELQRLDPTTTDVIAMLCALRPSVAHDPERLRAVDTLIDDARRRRKEPIWKGSTALDRTPDASQRIEAASA